MKLNTCKQCNRVFAATKVKPFCCGICRRQHLDTPQITANLVGANTNDQSNTQHTFE